MVGLEGGHSNHPLAPSRPTTRPVPFHSIVPLLFAVAWRAFDMAKSVHRI